MSQYQSFPDAAGHSQTVDKLKAMQLPDLAGRSFLDVGCNEGFFCGFAKFQGASRVVGIDHSPLYIARARARFPGCGFLNRSWNDLPSEQFSVILLASALHYAEDQAALIRTLVEHLTDDGLLVLELGIASSDQSEWVNVRRGIDERLFPSMSKVHEILSDFAWKWMGPSVRQQGDPVSRHVIHIARRRPVAYLLMEPPGYGKSSLAGDLFAKAGIEVVSGDSVVHAVARGEIRVSEALARAIEEGYSPYQIDQVMRRIFERGLANDMVAAWVDRLASSSGGSFAIDAYVPGEYHSHVEAALGLRGYMPVKLQWKRVGLSPLPEDYAAKRAEDFYLSLLAPDDPLQQGGASHAIEPKGFVDEVVEEDGWLGIRGWAVDASGNLPSVFVVRLGGRVFRVENVTVEMRLDVQQHLGLRHALVGYRLRIDMAGLKQSPDAIRKLRVGSTGCDAFLFSGAEEVVFKSPPGATW